MVGLKEVESIRKYKGFNEERKAGMSLKVGMCIPNGKKSRIRLPERILDLCAKSNIQITEIDMSTKLENQGPFDILLHKALDFYNEFDVDEATRKINQLISYASRQVNMIVVDDFSWCWKLTNRKCMVELIRSCQFKLKGIEVFLPKTIEVGEEVSEAEVRDLIAKSCINFPVVSKPYSAYFDDGSHVMTLVFSTEGMEKVRRPCLIQEFCNHGGVLYKVFVVGKNFKICERPSIKNLHAKLPTCNTLHFDSFRVSKTGQSFLKGIHSSDPNKRRWRNCDELANMLDGEIVNAIIARIQAITGLYLFGFDILIEEETGNYALIDLNQFPSYAGIGEEHFPKHLVELFKTL